jgi:hypothetical protein
MFLHYFTSFSIILDRYNIIPEIINKKVIKLHKRVLDGIIMIGNEISLEVDGKDIPMNDFVKKIIFGMILGSIGTLRDVDSDWKSVKLILKR